MIDILKVATAGLVVYEGFKILGKKEYADIIGFVTLMNVGFGVFFKISGWCGGVATWYNGLMNSRLIELVGKLF